MFLMTKDLHRPELEFKFVDLIVALPDTFESIYETLHIVGFLLLRRSHCQRG